MRMSTVPGSTTSGVEFFDLRVQVLRPRVVPFVRLDGSGTVVHRDEFDIAVEILTRE